VRAYKRRPASWLRPARFELTCYRPEDTRSNWLSLIVDQNRRVLVETDVGTVSAAMLLASPHDDRLDHRTLLDGTLGRRFLDGSGNDVT